MGKKPSVNMRFYRLLSPRRDSWLKGARCSFVVRAFAHGAMGRRIDPSWGGGARCSSVVRAFVHGAMGCQIDLS